MILIDTCIWVWWANGSEDLQPSHIRVIHEAQNEGVGLSVISCWEVAKKAEKGKMQLSIPVREWIDTALAMPGIVLFPLTPEIILDSTKLPGEFHNDPGDQMIVATARIHDLPLLTTDSKILNYPHVRNILK